MKTKHIKPMGYLILGLTLVLTAALPVREAQARDVSMDIAKQVLSIFANKSVNSLFGLFGGDGSLTPDQLTEVLDAGFRSYEISQTANAASTLHYNVISYNHQATHDTRKELVNALQTDSEKLLVRLDQEIIDHNSFWNLFSVYLFARDVQVSFHAEEYAITKEETIKELIAEYAATGLSVARRYIENHFVQRGLLKPYTDCVHWDSTKPMFDWNGNQVKGHVINETTHEAKWCAPSGNTAMQVIMAGGVPALQYFTRQEVFKHPKRNEWFYVYKKYPDKNEYWVWGAKNEKQAWQLLYRDSLDSFPNKLGTVSAHLMNWYRIVENLSQDPAMKQQAREDMLALGLIK